VKIGVDPARSRRTASELTPYARACYDSITTTPRGRGRAVAGGGAGALATAVTRANARAAGLQEVSAHA